MKENWKDIKGYEGIYQVSNLGNVRSSYVNNQRGSEFNTVLKQKKSRAGYMEVTLCLNSIKRSVLVHRLVACAFIENPSCYPVVNHLDECKWNNHFNNLEWCTQKHNATYGIGPDIKKTKVRQYDTQGNLIKKWDSMKEAQKALNIKYQGISRCCRGKRKTAYGFIWRYEVII